MIHTVIILFLNSGVPGKVPKGSKQPVKKAREIVFRKVTVVVRIYKVTVLKGY